MISCTISDEGGQTIYKLGKRFFSNEKDTASRQPDSIISCEKDFYGGILFLSPSLVLSP